MSELLNSLSSHHFTAFWVLLVVLLVERYLPWSDKYHPLSLVKLLAIRMSDKVLPSKDRPINQQKIAGSLACLFLILPIGLILMTFVFFAEFPVFFEGLMLLVALRFQNILNQSHNISSVLAADKKILARQMLAQLSLRETANMSPLGIVKANVESMLLRFNYQYCSVIFWFILTGGIGAILYRALFEFSQCWNLKLSRFEHFGRPVRSLVNLLQWVPSKISGLAFILAENVPAGFGKLQQRLSYNNTHYFILNVKGACLGIELGGPAYYNQRKVRGIKCGGQRQVVLADIRRTIGAINRTIAVLLTLYFLVCVAQLLYQYK